MTKKHNRKVKTNIYAIKRKDNNEVVGYLKSYSQASHFLNSQTDRKTKICPFYSEVTTFDKAFRSNIRLEEIIDEKSLEAIKTND